MYVFTVQYPVLVVTYGNNNVIRLATGTTSCYRPLTTPSQIQQCCGIFFINTICY